jgi:5-methylcytosine-specific restriction protein A
MRMCHCGAIVKGKCDRCKPSSSLGKTTAERGYDNRWRVLSERKRAIDPLCEECERQGVVTAADEVHHVVPISEAPWLRLKWSNLMSVCRACHAEIERRVAK